MKLTTLSALAFLAAVAVGGCNRQADNAGTNTGPTGAANTSQAPTTANNPAANGSAPTAGAAIDDAAVTAKVKAALAATEGISGTDISVETQQGTVILTGKVADATQSQRAARVAGGVEGVRSVDNRLQTSG
jgi:hyperosmotically inducible protein